MYSGWEEELQRKWLADRSQVHYELFNSIYEDEDEEKEDEGWEMEVEWRRQIRGH